MVRASIPISTVEINNCLLLQEFTSCTLWQFGGIGLLPAVNVLHRHRTSPSLLMSYCDCYRRLYSAFPIAIYKILAFLFFQSLGYAWVFSQVMQICFILNCKYFYWGHWMAFISAWVTFSFTHIACFLCALPIPYTNQLIFKVV